jgi:hypothetical protein
VTRVTHHAVKFNDNQLIQVSTLWESNMTIENPIQMLVSYENYLNMREFPYQRFYSLVVGDIPYHLAAGKC